MNPGGIIEKPGSAKENKTGSWRSGQRPKWLAEKCRHCSLCFHYCPEAAIIFEAGRMKGINYNYCKGCLICVAECPNQAILAEEEE